MSHISVYYTPKGSEKTPSEFQVNKSQTHLFRDPKYNIMYILKSDLLQLILP